MTPIEGHNVGRIFDRYKNGTPSQEQVQSHRHTCALQLAALYFCYCLYNNFHQHFCTVAISPLKTMRADIIGPTLATVLKK